MTDKQAHDLFEAAKAMVYTDGTEDHLEAESIWDALDVAVSAIEATVSKKETVGHDERLIALATAAGHTPRPGQAITWERVAFPLGIEPPYWELTVGEWSIAMGTYPWGVVNAVFESAISPERASRIAYGELP